VNVALLLPARNEEEGLGRVLPACLRGAPADAILVVDDGSSDGTAEVAARAGVAVLSWRPGRGKGAALRAGFARLLAEGRDAIVTLDADGQHDPAEIPRFVAAATESGADLVVGARADAVSRVRRLANRASAGLLSLVSGQRVLDAQSGYRLYRARLLRDATSGSDGFEFETEILARALASGHVAFVPIATIPARRPSHIHPLRDGVAIVARHVSVAAAILGARWRARRAAG
jgi:glycosyltransferase involved in cell wall biosynthesis